MGAVVYGVKDCAMKFFYWNKNFELGIPQIDAQHRRLVDIINELSEAVVRERTTDVDTIFAQLLDYAAVHFQEEEAIIAASPLMSEAEKEAHYRVHRSFIEKSREIVRRGDMLDGDTARRVLEFLTSWLISHILRSDKKYAAGEPADDAGDDWMRVPTVDRALIGAIAETERRFRILSDSSPTLMWVSDSDGRRMFFNRAWLDFVGVSDDGPLCAGYMGFVHPDDREAMARSVAAVGAARAPCEVEYRILHKDGGYRTMLERVLPRFDEGDTFLGLVASTTDITPIKQAEELLRQSGKDLDDLVAERTAHLHAMAHTDALTGIGNRRMLETRLDEEVVRAQRYAHPLAVAFIDIDHFKRVNDTLGHDAGDAAIAKVAHSLKAALRECDIIGRWGGEEFLAILIETNLLDAAEVVERMRKAVSEATAADAAPVTVSVGLACLRPGEDKHALIRRADKALYAAKASGRNCCRSDS
jgi:diguanylate cyclase (GGDEF)-like protein/hemerythrin-like metal-binding protein/PAS domain S-box-containing protein